MRKKKLILAVAASIMMSCTAPVFAGPEMFASVPAKHWSYDAVKQLAQAGIIDGYEDGYNGRSNLTRYEMAIMVANAMTNAQKADNQQKAQLEKLIKEYNAELISLGAQVGKEKKLEAKADAKGKVNFLFDNRIGYNYTSLDSTEVGGVGGKSIKDQGQFSERIRIYMTVPFGDNNDWVWNSRLYSQKTNLDKAENTDMKFDRFYVTGNNFMGGKLELGKNFIHPGKAGFFNYPGDAESAIYTWTNPAKDWSVRVGTGRATPQLWASTETRDLLLGEVTYKPTKTSDIELYNIKQDGATDKDLDMWGVSGAAELDKNTGVALSFEYAKNNADANSYHGKSGYWVALNSNYKATNYNPGMFTRLVNPFVKGDHGWALSYRHMPTGVAGKGNRAALLPWLPFSQDADGAWQNAFNDVDAWRVDYMYVPVKNIQLTFTYDHIKPINGNWTNNSFQTIANFVF